MPRRCKGRYVDPDTGSFLSDCYYPAMFGDYCTWHDAIDSGRITDRVDGKKLVPLRARRQKQPKSRARPLDQLLQEWG